MLLNSILQQALAATMLSSSISVAQDPSQDPAQGAGGPPSFALPPRFSLNTTVRGRSLTNGGIRASNADIDVARLGVDLDATYFARPNLILTGGLTYENTRFGFSNFGTVSGGGPNPLRDGRILSLSGGFISIKDQKWSYGATAVVRASGANSADFQDSIESGAVAFGRYSVNEKLAYNFGLAAFTQLADSALIFPILGLEWQASDRLRIETVPNPAGIGLQGTYTVQSNLDTFLRGAFENRNYRLDDAVYGGGVFRDQGFPVELGVRYRPNATSELSGSFGYIFSQNFQLENGAGQTVMDRNQKMTPFFSLAARYRF